MYKSVIFYVQKCILYIYIITFILYVETFRFVNSIEHIIIQPNIL